MSENETMRHNTGKPQLSHLLEFDGALDELARVCEHGAAKYARGNWKKGGPNASLESLTDSALRHAKKRMNGEVFDTDPKMHGQVRHLAQVAWNALAALYHELEAERSAEEWAAVESDGSQKD